VTCFSVFCGVTLYKGLAGATSCGCFGQLSVNPWYTLAADTPCLRGKVSDEREWFVETPVVLTLVEDANDPHMVSPPTSTARPPVTVKDGAYDFGMNSEDIGRNYVLVGIEQYAFRHIATWFSFASSSC